MKLRKLISNKIVIIFLLVALLLSLFYSTYSWFTSFYAVQNIVGSFYYEFNVTIYESTENIQMLEKAQPMGVSEAIERISPHVFIINNNDETPINYFIIIKDITPPGQEKINPKGINYIIDVNESGQYWNATLEPTPNQRHLIYRGEMTGNSTDIISIRLFLGPSSVVEDAASYTDPETGERVTRAFTAQVTVEAN